MIKTTTTIDQSYMLNGRIIVNVVHEHFSVDVEYMVFYYKEGNRWLLDTMDWSGDFRNLKIDDIIVSDKECENYFDIMDRLGVKYKEEVLNAAEKQIYNMEVKVF